MADSTHESRGETPETHELSSAQFGFDVVDRNGERVGRVRNVSLARTCLVVETDAGFLRRKHSHAVHVSAVEAVDLDAFTVSLTVTAADVAAAPEFRELDADCESALARHYGDLG